MQWSRVVHVVRAESNNVKRTLQINRTRRYARDLGPCKSQDRGPRASAAASHFSRFRFSRAEVASWPWRLRPFTVYF